MSRKDDLEKNIRDCYTLISQYESIQRDTDRPEERKRAERIVAEQWNLIKGSLDEYLPLCQDLGLPLASDVVEIAHHFSEYASMIGQRMGPEWTLEDLPPTTTVFIGREREKNEFGRTLAGILKPQDALDRPDWAQVFLIRGEGGMGKSTLLGEYAQMCEMHEGELFWVYIDWESTGVDSQEGTPKIMQVIASRFQNKYQVEFPHLRTIQFSRSRILGHIEGLRAEFRGSSYEEFDQFVKGKLSEADLTLYDPHQRQKPYSVAFIGDLIRIARSRPIILMFDAYETVWHFADEWLRDGLYRYCLRNPEVGRCFVFVVAGRLPDEVEFRHRDDARQYAHPLAYLHLMLDKFTEADIKAFLAKAVPDKQLSDPAVKRIHDVTRGIPLAVNEVAAIIRDEGDVEQVFGDIQEPLAEQRVIGLVTTRFLKHCFRQQTEARNRDLDCIYTFAVVRESDSDDARRRTQLLRDIWFRCRLVRSTEEFAGTVQRLQRQYSFLFVGSKMHPDVRSFMRKALRQGIIEPGRLLDINEAGKLLCELKLKERLREIESRQGREKAEREKYRDSQWQEWLLDLVHHLLWLQEYDAGMERLINEYVMGMQYGSKRFHQRLLSLVQDDLFYDSLPDRHRSRVQALGDLKEWFGSTRLKAERDELLNSLRSEARLPVLLIAARAAIDRRDFEAARLEITEAERLYQAGGKKDMDGEADLAEAYHLLGRRLAQSSKRRQVQQESLVILRKAIAWSPNDSHILCALGNVLANLLRLEEANLEFQKALQASRGMSEEDRKEVERETGQGLERVKRLEELGRVHPRKEARILTAEGNVLSARGEFEEAERLFRVAMRSDPAYIPARVKLSHLLRQVGDLDRALKLLDEVHIDEIPDNYQKATVYDAYGAIHLALKQLDQAIEAYQTSVSLSPDYINPLNGLGKTYIRMGKVEEAIVAFELALTIKRSSKLPLQASLFWVYNNLGIAYLFGGQLNGAMESFQIAEFLCRRYLEVESRQYDTWSNLGMSLLGQRRYEESQDAFRNFAHRCKARGIARELLDAVELVGRHDKTTGWRQVHTLVTTLL